MSEERARAEQLRDELKAFVGSHIHALYVKSTREDLDYVVERLVEDAIESDKDVFTLIGLKAKREVLKSNLTLFEDAVTTLDNRIEELILLEEQPSATQQETE